MNNMYDNINVPSVPKVFRIDEIERRNMILLANMSSTMRPSMTILSVLDNENINSIKDVNQ